MRPRPRPLRTLVFALFSCAAPAAGAGLSVPLDFEDPVHLGRARYPATASVPFASGVVRDLHRLVVRDPAGAATPAQAKMLEQWPDGSARWVLVDLLVTVPAKGSVRYTLKADGPADTHGPGVDLVADREGRRTLQNGALRVTLDPASGNLLSGLSTPGGAPIDRIPWPALHLDGPSTASASPIRISVETPGPVRTELLLQRDSPAGFAQELRLAMFAGQPVLRVQQTLTNLADPDTMPVRGLQVEIPGPFSAARFGFAGGERRLSPLREFHELSYPDDSGGRFDGSGKLGPDGWLRGARGETALTLFTRYPAEEYPQALAIGPEAARIDVLGANASPVAFGSGAAKTFEWWLVLEPGKTASDPARLAAMARHPLVARIPPDHLVASGALRGALAPTAPGANDFLARLTRALHGYLAHARTERWDDGPPVPCSDRAAERPRRGFTGALNWGDWNFPGYRDTAEHGCDPWGNLEYDLGAVLALGYWATGERPYLDTLLPAVRHYRDVDIIHHWAGHPERVGLNHPHKPMHFALSSVHGVDLGHTWLEGLLDGWRLTGEVRSLDAARGIAEVLTRMVGKAGNPRQLGWPMIALAAAADATGDAHYRNAARAYADRAVSAVRPEPSAGDWKMGILADGLATVYAATGDPAYRTWLETYTIALAAHPERHADPRYALPLADMAVLTNNAAYATLARDIAHRMPIGSWGKPLALAGRTGFRLLAPLARMPVVGPVR